MPTTAAYEAAIAAWFAEPEPFPATLVLSLDKVIDLAYGENPHQRAAYYADRGARRHLLSRVEQVHGKELSFNNLNDLSAARLLAREFALPCCVIVKHANPCGDRDRRDGGGGVRQGARIRSDLRVRRRRRAQPRRRRARSARSSRSSSSRCCSRPASAARRSRRCGKKQNTRILVDNERRVDEPGERHFKRVIGGMLVQDADSEIDDREGWTVACGKPDELQWGDLVFAWRVCKHVSSNAIVLAKDLATIGIGAGQMSRVDAVRIAVESAAAYGHDLAGAALASDAFFPFPDGPRIALDAGATSIVQPGGSKRDQDVIDAVEKAGGVMVFTGRRHFRH